MKNVRLFLLGLLGAFLLNSCSKDDDEIITEPVLQGDYVNGIFVLNEGGTGSVTFISEDLQTVEQEIYAAVNEGDDIGQYAQSMFFSEELAFIISGGSNLITVVDRFTFELIGKVDSGLEGPRYGVAVDGKAYVTNQAGWETDQDDYIAVIDIETLTVEETVIVNAVAEYILEGSGLLYIQNAAFGSGNQISVFNPSNNTIEETLTVGDGLNSIDIEDNTLYALSSGTLEMINLTTHETTTEIESDGFSMAQNLDVENGIIYYTIENGVYSMGAGATEPASDPFIEYDSDSPYGVMYGFEVEDDRVFIGDGGDFSSNSFVEIYSTTGDFLEKIQVGIAPNGFYFN